MGRETGARHKAQGTGKPAKTILVPACLLFFILSLAPCALCQNNWPGVDESVVEKIAGEHGRQAHGPLINTDKGDLLLFVFLLAGAVGGFAAGYFWRMLVEGKGEKR